jgi:hypothetical protein
MRTADNSGYSSPAAALGAQPTHQKWWLDITPDDRFSPLIGCNLRRRESYRRDVVPYLRARGVADDLMIEQFVRLDLEHLAHALTVVFSSDHEVVLKSIMPDHLYLVINEVNPIIDHVGRELFGPIDFYLEVLHDLAPRLGLDHQPLPPGDKITSNGDAVFQSVQVVEALRQFDPDLEGVTIAKIFFAERDRPSATGCLELFQPALRDGSAPQCHRHTVERLANLHSDTSEGGATLSMQPPICHISIEAPDVDTVHAIHDVAKTDTSGMLMPYVDRVVENRGDHSTNTKLSVKSHPDSPLFNKIIEVVYHQV